MKPHWFLALVIAFLVLPPTSPCQDDPTKAAPEPLYHAGGGVKAPRATYTPDPTYPRKARKPRHEDTVVLRVIVGRDGLPRDVKVARSLSPEFDEAAMDAVMKWRFDPATKEGKPVAVLVNIEITFKR
jgi:protein TonB